MTHAARGETFSSKPPIGAQPTEPFWLELLRVILANRRLVILLPVLLTTIVLAYKFLQPRQYTVEASFMTQGQARGGSAQGLAGSLGFGALLNNSGSSIDFYAGLIESKEILRRVANRTYRTSVSREVTLPEFFEISADRPVERTERVVEKLNSVVQVRTNRLSGLVEFSVTTKDPAISLEVANEILKTINEFNLYSRQTQARYERQFLEERFALASAELAGTENRLGDFLRQNRDVSSTGLSMTRDRLQRQVAMRQAVVTSLANALEQARLDEVRNTPVITTVNTPVLPAFPARRQLAQTAFLTLFGGIGVAVLLGFTRLAVSRARANDPSSFSEIQKVLSIFKRPRRRSA